MARITEVSPADEARVIEIVCMEIDAVRETITSEASWKRLESYFYEQMLQGSQTLPTRVVLAWAEAGHPAADRAIRHYAATMVDQGREGELLVQVRNYIVKTLLEPFVPYPRGRQCSLAGRKLHPTHGAFHHLQVLEAYAPRGSHTYNR